MRAGKLRHLGIIENLYEIRNEIGESVKVWQEYARTRCDIKPLSGNEKYVSKEKHATATHQVITRYIVGVNPKMRLISRGRTFDIQYSINVGEKDRMMQLIVEEQADD